MTLAKSSVKAKLSRVDQNHNPLSVSCRFCHHPKTHKHGKTSKGNQRYFCPACQQTFTDGFDSLFYRRRLAPEQIQTVIQLYREGKSRRGIARQTKLAYNTVKSIINAASQLRL